MLWGGVHKAPSPTAGVARFPKSPQAVGLGTAAFAPCLPTGVAVDTPNLCTHNPAHTCDGGTRTHSSLCRHTHAHIHIFTCNPAGADARTHMHARAQAHTHTHTHTHGGLRPGMFHPLCEPSLNPPDHVGHGGIRCPMGTCKSSIHGYTWVTLCLSSSPVLTARQR